MTKNLHNQEQVAAVKAMQGRHPQGLRREPAAAIESGAPRRSSAARSDSHRAGDEGGPRRAKKWRRDRRRSFALGVQTFPLLALSHWQAQIKKHLSRGRIMGPCA
jgi:hypothetical protein